MKHNLKTLHAMLYQEHTDKISCRLYNEKLIEELQQLKQGYYGDCQDVVTDILNLILGTKK